VADAQKFRFNWLLFGLFDPHVSFEVSNLVSSKS
jgi:hypothetical protein